MFVLFRQTCVVNVCVCFSTDKYLGQTSRFLTRKMALQTGKWLSQAHRSALVSLSTSSVQGWSSNLASFIQFSTGEQSTRQLTNYSGAAQGGASIHRLVTILKNNRGNIFSVDHSLSTTVSISHISSNKMMISSIILCLNSDSDSLNRRQKQTM